MFVDLAKDAIQKISSKGKLPIIVGGTGLYLKMLLENYKMPKGEPDKALRTELEALAEHEGVEEVYKILLGLDEKYAKTVHPNNLNRVIRAIEILDSQQKSMENARGKNESEYNVKWIGLDARDRNFLYEKINKRVDFMIKSGLEKEASLIYEKYGASKLVSNTIGYKEFLPCFKNEITLEEVIEKIKQNTRRYAKRQLTWFRHQKGINWFYIDEMSEDKIFELALGL